MIHRFAVALLAGILATSAPARPADLTVFAAASMKTALDLADDAYAKASGKTVAVSYAASSALARQIEDGAPADVFISADLDWMDDLAKHAAIKPETRSNLLGNHLVLITQTARPVTLAIGPGMKLAEALGDGRLAIPNVDSVPAGKYGKAALTKLGVWSSVEGHLAPAENVRAALDYVSRGETPLGIVYATDAVADARVRVVGAFPDDTHAPIVYPVAVTVTAKGTAAADYLVFLRGEAARKAFVSQGFEVLD